MQRDNDKATGKNAVALLKECTEHGVTVGGDPEAREKAPSDVTNFLKSIFAMSQ